MFFAHSSSNNFFPPFLVLCSLHWFSFFFFSQCKSSYFLHSCRCSTSTLHNSVIHPDEKKFEDGEGRKEGQGKDLTRIFLGQRQGYQSKRQKKAVKTHILMYFFYSRFIVMYLILRRLDSSRTFAILNIAVLNVFISHNFDYFSRMVYQLGFRKETEGTCKWG